MMEKLWVLYHMRPGYLQAIGESILGIAQSAGAAVHMRPLNRGHGLHHVIGPRAASQPGKPRPFASATRSGLEIVVIYSPIQFRGGASWGAALPPSGHFRGKPAARMGQRWRGRVGRSAVDAERPAVHKPPSDIPVPGPVETPAVPEATMRRQAAELLSAALANCHACQNWLLSPVANVDRARLTIAKVIRDVKALERLLG
jgi:hypothetical protein